jgi:coiled-coil domain-containing protein 6
MSSAPSTPRGCSDVDALSKALTHERALRHACEEELRRVRLSAEKFAQSVEAEEEFLVSALNKKLEKVTHEKMELERSGGRTGTGTTGTTEGDAASTTTTLTEALEARLATLQGEKVALENALEREQECMVNKLTTVLESLGRERQTVARERDRLRGDLAKEKDEATRLKLEKVKIENEMENEEEHIVNMLQGQLQMLMSRNRALERQVRSLGGTVSDSEFSDDGYYHGHHGLASPTRSGPNFTPFGNARDAFANRRSRPANSSAATSPFASDRESVSPSRRRLSLRGGDSPANLSIRSVSSEPRSPRTSG